MTFEGWIDTSPSGTINSILFGEILSGYPPTHESNASKNRWEYDVKCILPSGEYGFFSRAIIAEGFSGILDSVQRVVNCSGDYSRSAFNPDNTTLTGTMTKGDRCLVAFIGGNTSFPVILAFMPHPLSEVTVDDPQVKPEYEEDGVEFDQETTYPSYKARFNGVELFINEIGELKISHQGIQAITQSSGPFTQIEIDPPSLSELAEMSFSSGGGFSVYSSNHQFLNLDPLSGFVQVGDGSSSLNLYSKIDGSDSSFSLVTSGQGNLFAEKELFITCNDSMFIEVAKDLTEVIKGEQTTEITSKYSFTVGADWLADITGNMELSVGGDYTADVSGSVEMNASSGSFLRLESGKAALGNNSVELVDIVYQTLQILSTTTAAGFGAPLSTVGQFGQFAAQLVALKE